MVQRLAQFRITFFDLLEKPHIFDGDHRQRRERFQKLDLLSGERTNFGATDHDGADRYTLTQKGRGEDRSRAADPLMCFGFRKFLVEFRHNVLDMYRLSLQHRPSGWVESGGTKSFSCRSGQPDGPIRSCNLSELTLSAMDDRVIGVTQSRRILGDRV